MKLALLGALTIGLSLGLLGSGGSILTVPVLIYLVGEPEKLAIAESLAIVGLVAMIGAIPYARRGLIDWKNVVWFGGPGMVGAFLGAAASQYITASVQLGLFAVVMLGAARFMLRPLKLNQSEVSRKLWKVILDGLLVGALTGLVGVGGGFLIVPALVLLGGLPMDRAVGTSLLIIALKSASGFAKYHAVMDSLDLEIDWTLILMLSAVGALGTLAGGQIGNRISKERLQRIFGVFLVLMALGILADRILGLV